MNTAQKITAIFDDIQQVSSEVSATAFCIEELAENLHGRWEDKARNENCELAAAGALLVYIAHRILKKYHSAKPPVLPPIFESIKVAAVEDPRK